MNDPNRAVERLVGSSEADLKERVEQEIQSIDVALDDASDPNHVFVKDNFVDRHGGCGLAHIYRTSTSNYVETPVSGENGQCI
jgi:hypothetical protein